ncbi:glycosyltransferase, partial [Mitsuaria sp. WAJ17]|uniref:glycosyltransferase n=1 Tax=Mitsuaria sp. WAJ17 TaxID=2761452 RepID=UPI0015FFE171
WALRRLCRAWRPEVLVAHGFPEHLLGRWAGLLAGVPKLVQVEHNSRERYTRWKLAQARWLAARSARLVAVSEGVKAVLLKLGMPADKTLAIPNGVDLRPFAEGADKPFEDRIAG